MEGRNKIQKRRPGEQVVARIGAVRPKSAAANSFAAGFEMHLPLPALISTSHNHHLPTSPASVGIQSCGSSNIMSRNCSRSESLCSAVQRGMGNLLLLLTSACSSVCSHLRHDFLSWKQDQDMREIKVMRRYHIQNRDDYHK